MNVSTIRNNKFSLSTLVLYIIGIAGIGLVVYFGNQILANLDNLKGRAALSVDVLNDQAEVYINDKLAGTTPYESKDIIPGENKITLKTKARQFETFVEFIPNNKKNIHGVGIFRDLGTSDTFSSGQEFWFEKDNSDNIVQIVSEPSNASVYIDNTEVGKTPFASNNLSEGEYDLRVEAVGYEAQTRRINVKKDYTLNVNLKLFPTPVPSKVKAFEGSPNLFDVSTDNNVIASDTESWVNAIIYWNTTRGINLEGTGMNKELVFDYYLDYKGNVYDKEGIQILNKEEFQKLKDAKNGAYLGRLSDGPGLTKEAKEGFESLTGSVALGGKKAMVLETGTGWLRVRDVASLNGIEVAKIDVGKEYPVIEVGTGWVKVKASDTVEGWVSSDYVKVSE